MANEFSTPDRAPIADKAGNVTKDWREWFSVARMVLSAARSSGATADRPTKDLWVGRTYFDTDLGIPIWVQSVRPTVWVNAAGATV